MHDKSCAGVCIEEIRLVCSVCCVWISRTNYASYVGIWCVNEGEGTLSERGLTKISRGRVVECRMYGRTLSFSNIAKQKSSYRVRDPGSALSTWRWPIGQKWKWNGVHEVLSISPSPVTSFSSQWFFFFSVPVMHLLRYIPHIISRHHPWLNFLYGEALFCLPARYSQEDKTFHKFLINNPRSHLWVWGFWSCRFINKTWTRWLYTWSLTSKLRS